MKLKYSNQQHREYMCMTRKSATQWIALFENDTDFYSADYWDLLTGMWYAAKPVMVSDALKMMHNIKSPYTARKYLQFLIDRKVIIEKQNPGDNRSTLIELSSDMKKKLDGYFDMLIESMFEACDKVKAAK